MGQVSTDAVHTLFTIVFGDEQTTQLPLPSVVCVSELQTHNPPTINFGVMQQSPFESVTEFEGSHTHVEF